MFNKEFLKTLTIIYVEDDNSIRESLGAILQKVFKEVILCTDGQDGLEKFKASSSSIDAIISDINMPRMNGLEMLGKIREFNTDVPAIMTTAHGESDFLMEAIKVNVSYYALKPINTPLLLENIQKFCMIKYQQSLIVQKERELSAYIDIVDQVATICTLDKDLNFTDINELFSDVSQYSSKDIIGQNIKLITHGDIIPTIYTDMANEISQGNNWEGLYKSIDKENNIFYLRLSAIPNYNESLKEFNGCTLIGFESTETEQEKRDTMQRVRLNIIEQRKKEFALNNKIKTLEATKPTVSNSSDVSFIKESLDRYKVKNSKLLNQLNHYEKDISNLEAKLSNIVETELSKRHELMDRNKSLISENETLKESMINTQNRLTKVEKQLEKRSEK